MAKVVLNIPGIEEPKEVEAESVSQLMEQLEVPEGYEIRLLRGDEVLGPDSVLREGDQIRVRPVLRGA